MTTGPAVASEPVDTSSLTGRWSCDDEGKYYLRQLGATVWWFGRSKNDGEFWSNVFRGTLKGNVLDGEWADVPIGRDLLSGTMTLEVRVAEGRVTGLRKISQIGGDFLGENWKRVD
jgi:hypothetical protein